MKKRKIFRYFKLLFRLDPAYFTVVLTAVCAILPVLILNMYRRMFE